MATEETLWQSSTGTGDDASSWSNGVPDLSIEPTIARFDGLLSQKALRTGLADFDCQRLITMPEYTGQIGGPGTPLEAEIGERCILRGRGAHYIDFKTGSFALVICDSTNRNNAGRLSGSMSRVCVKNGKWTLTNKAILSQQVVIDGPDADVEIVDRDTTENAPPVIVLTAGKLTNWRNSGAANYKIIILGGELVQYGNLLVSDLVVVGPGGSFKYLPITEPASDPQIIMASGFTDFRSAGFQFGVDKAIIGRFAEVEGSTMEAGGFPPGSLSAPIDLREEYP